jgi:LuxR family maltose regulon positive regulatory protein
MIIATCQLAEMQAMQGQLSQSWVTLKKAQYMAIGPDGKALPLAGLADVGFGEILLERNELVEADVYLKRGVDTSGTLWWLSNLDGMISIAHLRQVQGDIPGSEKIIDDASRLALSSESSQWDDTIVSAIAVRMALRREDLHSAEHWWRKGTFPNFLASIPLEDYPYHIYEYLVLTQVRLLIMLGKEQENQVYLHQSLDILDSLMLEARQFQRVTSQLEIQILQAVAYLTLGDVQRAGIFFNAALAQGEPGGYRRIFLDGGKPVARLLENCRAEKSEKDFNLPTIGYIDGLLESIGKEAGKWEIPQTLSRETKQVVGTVAEDGMPVSLSAREIEVLTLIAEGKSNQEISAQLYLALNTVKRHAYNIYAKLGVKKRTQAVSKARHLGLLP